MPITAPAKLLNLFQIIGNANAKDTNVDLMDFIINTILTKKHGAKLNLVVSKMEHI